MTQLLEPRNSVSEATISPEEYKGLVERVKRLQGRMRLQEAVYLLPFALLAGGGVGLVVAIISRIRPTFTWEQVLIIALAALMIGVAGVLGYALLRPRRLLETARRADLALGLKERISTAIEGHDDPERLGYAGMGARQFNDARQAMEGLKPNKALPLRLPKRPALAALLVIPLLAAALIIPNPFSDVVKENQEIQKQVQQEAKKIEDLKNQIEKNNPDAAKKDPKLQELLKQLEKVKQELLEKSDNKDDAIASLQKAEQELQKLADPQQPAQKAALEQLAKDLSSNDLTKPAGEALSQNSPDKFDKAAAELNKAAQNIDQLKNNPQQAQQLSDKLAKDAQNFKNSDPNLSQKLQQASDALKPDNLSKNPQQAQQALQNLGNQLQQTGQNQKTQEQLKQAQSQLQKSEQSINQSGQQSGKQQSGQQNGKQSGQRGEKDDSGDTGNPGNNMQSGDQQGDQTGDQQGDQGQSGQPGQQGQQSQQGQQGQQGQRGQRGDGQQDAQDGQGQGDQGQGQQGDQGQGQGQQGQQGQNGQQNGQSNQSGQGGSKAGKGSNDNFYPNPTMRNQDGKQVNVGGKKGDGPQNSQTVNGGQASGEAKVPLSDYIEAYRNAASESLDKNYVPITLKDVVKGYFDDLNEKSGNGK